MSRISPSADEPANEPLWARWLATIVRFVVDNLWPLILGVAVGLGLGLFLAWNVWPVEYEEATIADLDAQTQAYYIAAVAEAYVYYGTAQALDVAEQRLALFGDDLPQALDQAIEYYAQSGDPNAAIYQSNIRQLQADLAADGFIPAPAVEEVPAVTPAAEADGAEAGEAGGRPWFLIGLGTVLLVVCAALLIRWRRGGRDGADATWSNVDDEDRAAGAAATAAPAGADAYHSDARLDVGPQPAARDFVDAEDYGFADEPDEAEEASRRTPSASTVEEGGFEADPWDEEPADEPAPPAPRMAGTAVTPPAAAIAGAAQPPVELGRFTAHYRIGMRDYEESQNIRAASGPYIGEYGMGVNMKNGILQNNPEQVMALDVWLFDKVDPTKLMSQTRVLLAEYVFDNGMEDAFPREKPDDLEPIIAETGQRFQLLGNKLLLDCEVVEATCVPSGPAKGIFESVQVSMTVFRIP
jgi:hypothetical protein